MLRDFRIPYAMMITSKLKSAIADDKKLISSQIIGAAILGESSFVKELRESLQQKRETISDLEKIESEICRLPRNSFEIENLISRLFNRVPIEGFKELESYLLEKENE